MEKQVFEKIKAWYEGVKAKDAANKAEAEQRMAEWRQRNEEYQREHGVSRWAPVDKGSASGGAIVGAIILYGLAALGLLGMILWGIALVGAMMQGKDGDAVGGLSLFLLAWNAGWTLLFGYLGKVVIDRSRRRDLQMTALITAAQGRPLS